jgi:acyl carrier protein
VNREPNEAVVIECLQRVAPEIDADSLDADADIRRELDLDSMDFLNFVEALHEQTGIDIPESDYGKLRSITTCVEHLQRRRDQRV